MNESASEMDTSALTPDAPVIETTTVAEPPVTTETVAATTETPAADATTDEPAADAGTGAKRGGMLEELIEHRTVRRELQRQLEQLQPVIARLTPELEQAIRENRIIVKPQATTEDGRRTQLEATAKRLRLTLADGSPDLDAAAAVDSYVREAASAAVAPLQHETQLQKARNNIAIAVAHAEKNGYDVETIRQHYENAMRAPNGAALVADPGVAEELWYGAVGRAATAGKGRTAPATDKGKDAAPVVIPAESTGRRGATTGIQLSPKLAAIYKDNGMDPAKTAGPIVRDARGGIAME